MHSDGSEDFVFEHTWVKGTTTSAGKETGNLFILNSNMLNIVDFNSVELSESPSGDIEFQYNLRLKCKELKKEMALCFVDMELSDIEDSDEDMEDAKGSTKGEW